MYALVLHFSTRKSSDERERNGRKIARRCVIFNKTRSTIFETERVSQDYVREFAGRYLMKHIVGVYTERYENVTASTRVKCHRSSRTGYKPSAQRSSWLYELSARQRQKKEGREEKRRKYEGI